MGKQFENIPLLAEFSDQHLADVLAECSYVEMQPGQKLYTEGEPAEHFYVLLEGELQVSRNVDGQNVALYTYRPGDFTGEMSLLLHKPWLTTAIADQPSRLLCMSAATFYEKLVNSSPVAKIMLPIMAKRIESADVLVHQRAKLASLGKMSAGLAHELNNPAAAATRSAATLRDTYQQVNTLTWKLNEQNFSVEQVSALSSLANEVTRRPESLVPLDALTQADREDELTTWLDEHDILDSYELAPDLVRSGITVERLNSLAADVPPGNLPDILSWLDGTIQIAGLIGEIEHSTRRISELVGAVKTYTYMDQDTLKEVDIHEGLESTLIMLNHKLRKGVEVSRDYDRSLPRIWAYGSELNEVWTNIIDNAVDAMDGKGKITIKTRLEADDIIVEIGDNGPGIKPENVPHLFEPFFSTKGVGEGTGLGLNISYNIVVNHHHGDIRAESEPGNTRFQVRLPIHQPPNRARNGPA